jgi:tetratricopeptide (TPR) repeat protein
VAFEGDLKNLPLADVLQTINGNSLTGTLTVKDQKGERKLAFTQGMIVAFAPAPGDGHPVIDALAKRRIVAKPDAEKARSGFLGKRKTLRLALATRGLVKEEDYVKVVKEDVLEGIYELFLENDRTFKFEDGQPDLAQWDQDQLAAEVRLPAAPIVMEGARRCDEWSRIRRSIGTFNEVLVRDGGPEEKDDDTTKELLQLADGSRDLAAVLDQLPVPRFKGCEAAAALIAARRLRPASVNEYVELGKKAEERGAFDEAARLYERGLSTERGNVGMRARRANALERAGRKTEAADERKLLAVAFLEQGKRQDAAAELSRAADLSPRDPAPLERRLALALDDQDKDVARVMATRLAALLEDLGLHDKARDALRSELARWPDDDEVREKLAELLHRQGDVKASLSEWAELGNRALRAEQHALAAARFRKALEVDPSDQGVRALLADIESGEITARKIRRMKRIWLTLATTVLALLAAVLGREAVARLALDTFHRDTGYMSAADGTPDGIRAALAELLGKRDAYRYTLAAREADQLSLTLIELFARVYDRTRSLSVLKTRLKGVPIVADTMVHDQVLAIVGEAGGTYTLEDKVRQGDELNASGDHKKAEEAFASADHCIDDAAAWLAKSSDAARNQDWLVEAVGRLDRARLRVRVGWVRALPLCPEARAKLEDLVGAHMPGLDVKKPG